MAGAADRAAECTMRWICTRDREVGAHTRSGSRRGQGSTRNGDAAFRGLLNNPSGSDVAPVVAEFDGAEANFAAAGHAYGEAKVDSAVGLLLLA